MPCYDWLWLLSCAEVCEDVCSHCSNRRGGVREGNTYKYYEGTVKGVVGVMNTKRMKPEADEKKGESWWLRTLSHANGFHSVRNFDALVVTSAPPYASEEYGVAPGFCI